MLLKHDLIFLYMNFSDKTEKAAPDWHLLHLSCACYTIRHCLRAYSSAVECVHGMDEVGVRLPVGPQNE